VAIEEKRFGPEHPRVAERLDKLAQLLRATGRLAEAEPSMRRVLAISEKHFAPDHPNVATARDNLARLLREAKRPKEAEELLGSAQRR
jgi:tetratricopeptide (TPR) repeat protein